MAGLKVVGNIFGQPVGEQEPQAATGGRLKLVGNVFGDSAEAPVDPGPMPELEMDPNALGSLTMGANPFAQDPYASPVQPQLTGNSMDATTGSQYLADQSTGPVNKLPLMEQPRPEQPLPTVQGIVEKLDAEGAGHSKEELAYLVDLTELYAGQKLPDNLKDEQGLELQYMYEKDPKKKKEIAAQLGIARVRNKTEMEAFDRRLAEMQELGMKPEEYINFERYRNEKNSDTGQYMPLTDNPVSRGVYQGIQGLVGMADNAMNRTAQIGHNIAGYATGDEEHYKMAEGFGKEADRNNRQAQFRDEYQSYLDKQSALGENGAWAVRSAVDSLVKSMALGGAGGAASRMLGGAGIGGAMGAQVGAFTMDAADQDYSQNHDLSKALEAGAIEGGMTLLFGQLGKARGLKSLEEAIGDPKWSGLSNFVKGLGLEVGEEVSIAVSQTGSNYRHGQMGKDFDPENPLLSYSADQLSSALQAAGPTIIAMGAHGGAAKMASFLENPSLETAKEAGIPEAMAATDEEAVDLAGQAQDALQEIIDQETIDREVAAEMEAEGEVEGEPATEAPADPGQQAEPQVKPEPTAAPEPTEETLFSVGDRTYSIKNAGKDSRGRTKWVGVIEGGGVGDGYRQKVEIFGDKGLAWLKESMRKQADEYRKRTGGQTTVDAQATVRSVEEVEETEESILEPESDQSPEPDQSLERQRDIEAQAKLDIKVGDNVTVTGEERLYPKGLDVIGVTSGGYIVKNPTDPKGEGFFISVRKTAKRESAASPIATGPTEQPATDYPPPVDYSKRKLRSTDAPPSRAQDWIRNTVSRAPVGQSTQELAEDIRKGHDDKSYYRYLKQENISLEEAIDRLRNLEPTNATQTIDQPVPARPDATSSVGPVEPSTPGSSSAVPRSGPATEQVAEPAAEQRPVDAATTDGSGETAATEQPVERRSSRVDRKPKVRGTKRYPRLTESQFRDQMKSLIRQGGDSRVPISEEQIEATIKILEVRARAAEMSLEDYIADRVAKVEQAKWDDYKEHFKDRKDDDVITDKGVRQKKGTRASEANGLTDTPVNRDQTKTPEFNAMIEIDEKLLDSRTKGLQVHSFDITPAMRESALTEGQPLFQKDSSDERLPARAAINFLDSDGRAIIRIFEQGNATSVLHEFVHIFRTDLTGEDLRIAEKAVGVKDGQWTRKNDEDFVDMFFKWLTTGKAANPDIANIFSKFKKWILGLYKVARDLHNDIKVPKEMAEVFDRLFLNPAEIAARAAEIAEKRAATAKKRSSRRAMTPVQKRIDTLLDKDEISEDQAKYLLEVGDETAKDLLDSAKHHAEVSNGSIIELLNELKEFNTLDQRTRLRGRLEKNEEAKDRVDVDLMEDRLTRFNDHLGRDTSYPRIRSEAIALGGDTADIASGLRELLSETQEETKARKGWKPFDIALDEVIEDYKKNLANIESGNPQPQSFEDDPWDELDDSFDISSFVDATESKVEGAQPAKPSTPGGFAFEDGDEYRSNEPEEEFTLKNDPERRVAGKFDNAINDKQKGLLGEREDLEGQQDMFEEEGGSFDYSGTGDASPDFAGTRQAGNPKPATVKLGADTVIRPVPLVELIRVIRQMGIIPQVIAKMRAYGYFTENGPGIKVRADLAEDSQALAGVVAHEFGHWADYAPDGSLKRGNILGRIASLNSYLKHWLAGRPGGPGPLTEDDRKRLRKLAKQLAGKNATVEVKREIMEEMPVTPQDILNIWNLVDQSQLNPELLAYIKGTSTAEKLSIVKEAMKGVVPEKLKKFAQKVGTGKYKTFKEAIDADADTAASIYQQMVMDEIKKRELLARDTITKELKALSAWWRGPFSPNDKYRNSSKELYADAISVLFNSPGDLQQRAPEFFRGFFAYLETKKGFRDAYLDIQDLLAGTPEELMAARRLDVREMYGNGEEVLRARAAEIESGKQSALDYLRQSLFDKAYPVFTKEGKTEGSWDEANAARYALEELGYVRNPLHLFAKDVNEQVKKPLNDLGIDWSTVGEYMQMDRIAHGDRGGAALDAQNIIMQMTGKDTWAEAKQDYIESLEIDTQGRDPSAMELLEAAMSGKINPLGYTPEIAREYLAGLKKELGNEAYAAMQDAVQKYHDIHWKHVLEAVKAGTYSKQQVDTILAPNKDHYAPFAVIKYLDTRIKAGIFRQIGTFEGNMNPADALLMKTMSLIRLNELQKAKNAVREQLRENGELPPGQVIDKYHRMKAPPIGKENLIILENGKPVAYAVEPYVAKVFALHDIGTLGRLAKWMGSSYRVFHPLWIGYNFGWQLSNLIRDPKRTYVNSTLLDSGESLQYRILSALADVGRVPYNLLKAVPTAARGAFGFDDALFRQMQEERAITTPLSKQRPGDDSIQYDKLLAETGVWEGPKRSAIIRALETIANGVENMGAFTENLSKVAMYNMATKRGITGRKRAYIVRNLAGTPNTQRKGLWNDVSNSTFMYSNVILQGYRADAEVAINPNTRTGRWIRAGLIDYMPKAAMMAVAAGLFGEWIKDLMDEIPEYDKAKYICIPIRRTAEGKPIYLRLPHNDTDRVLAAVAWKVANAEGLSSASEAFSLVSGEVPGPNVYFTLASKWTQFLSGKNPRDDFRDRDILTDDQQLAGGWERLKPMLLWTTDLAGEPGKYIRVASEWDRKTATGEKTGTFEKFIAAVPGLSRLVKVSDSGKKDEQYDLINEEKRARAELRLKLPPEVRAATRELSFLSNRVDPLTEQEKTKKELLQKWFNRSYVPLAREVAETTSETQKDALRAKILSRLQGLEENYMGPVAEDKAKRAVLGLFYPEKKDDESEEDYQARLSESNAKTAEADAWLRKNMQNQHVRKAIKAATALDKAPRRGSRAAERWDVWNKWREIAESW